MSLTMFNFPEVDKEISTFIGKGTHLAYGYRQAQAALLSVDVNLPIFARLFELVKQLMDRRIEAFMRFELTRGKKFTFPDITPFPSFEGKKAVDILRALFEVEKDLHMTTVNLCKVATDKGDMSLVGYLQTEVIPKQLKYVSFRAEMIHDLETRGDDVNTFLVEKLKIPFYIARLEKKLHKKVVKSERFCCHVTSRVGEPKHQN